MFVAYTRGAGYVLGLLLGGHQPMTNSGRGGRIERNNFLTTIAALVVSALAFVLPAAAQGVMVVAPHPDDDVITASGVVRRAVLRGETVRVVYVTNGDYAGTSYGFQRQGEAVGAEAQLGVPESNLIFLGYPDGSLKTIWQNYTTSAS